MKRHHRRLFNLFAFLLLFGAIYLNMFGMETAIPHLPDNSQVKKVPQEKLASKTAPVKGA